MKKLRDPYPITDVYLLEMNAVDAATVTVGDLCERLSNDFHIDRVPSYNILVKHITYLQNASSLSFLSS